MIPRIAITPKETHALLVPDESRLKKRTELKMNPFLLSFRINSTMEAGKIRLI